MTITAFLGILTIAIFGYFTGYYGLLFALNLGCVFLIVTLAVVSWRGRGRRRGEPA